jgi:predicted deacylase
MSSSRNDTETNTKLKVYIQAAIHGNEPASDQGALAFLGKLDANQTYAASLLDKMDILIVPRFNVDGVAHFQRRLASDLDPNRDHIKLDSQQSRHVKQIFSDYRPHVALDLHEFRGPTVFGRHYQHGNDA